ncbi:MAG: glycoside hydrolase family 9 protein [Tannerella sp.]|jgi:endoglucanase|nr:glycoside hydrolase family 9 protein [Tannerella sp.]
MNKKIYIVFLAVVLMAGYALALLTSCKGAELHSTAETPWITFSEVRTASDCVLVAFFNCDTLDINTIDISTPAEWKINGVSAEAVHAYAMQTDGIHYHVYLETGKLIKGKKYKVETPYGTKSIRFRERDVFCESIKTNQVGYSARSTTRYANFTIWLGTGGSRKIEGDLPEYQVVDTKNKVVASGRMKDIGDDVSTGGHVYRFDLSAVPEGGPYKITVDGYGSSYPFGVGGEFSNMLAYTIFRAQYLQRCGCPVHEPDIRKNPCHTLVYDVDGPIGEANIDVVGDEPTIACYGGYHDAGDADRRAYHISNPILNLMIYETFPEYFTDGQFRIPGDFDADYQILNYENKIPDIIDEAMWGTLIWEYLQNEDGTVHFGTETRGYPSPFAAPLDLDTKKYGTVRVDDRATSPAAGLFMHLARIIKPYNPQKSAVLVDRGERAFKAIGTKIAAPEKLYYHIQRYLLTRDEADHAEIRKLYTVVDSMKYHLYLTPGYSLNDSRFDNPAYIMSYTLEKNVRTDAAIVDYFKAAIKDAADANIAELRAHAFPVGNNPAAGGWGHNVRQPQYAAIPLLYWRLTNEQAYFDAASELMDYKLGLNPIGICYITTLGFHQVLNLHDRESAYTKELGWGAKPGITAFGPGVAPRASVTDRNRRYNEGALPGFSELPRERLFVDNREIINFTEFTIFETMHYDALYTILAGGGKWNGVNPF